MCFRKSLIWIFLSFQISYLFSDNVTSGESLQYELNYNCSIRRIKSIRHLELDWEFSSTYLSESRIVSDFRTKGNHISIECKMVGQNYFNQLWVSSLQVVLISWKFSIWNFVLHFRSSFIQKALWKRSNSIVRYTL